MIITRTPYRISFFGGGTDYPAWYESYGGSVLAATINKYCYICLRLMPPYFGSKYRVFWSKMENVNSVDEIEHAGVRGCLRYLGISDGIEINHAGDMPARSGLGSSSSFTVGMLNACHVLSSSPIGREQLAREAIAVEQNVLGETVGIQDQIQCAFGGLNNIEIFPNGDFRVWPISITPSTRKDFSSWLMLVFTGIQRNASEIASAQVSNVKFRRKQLHDIASLVLPGREALVRGNFDTFGKLLHESWLLKRQLSDKISSSSIDSIYDRAILSGAIGGKVLGAGGGGFMLFCAPPDAHERIRRELGMFITSPVEFEDNGSQVVQFG